MKKWLWMVGIALVVSGCQEEATNETGMDSGAGSEQVEHAGWHTDFEAAKAVAKQEGKHVLIDFSGSDWCSWCIKLDNEVFAKKAFQDYAKENLVMVLADFPRDKSNQSASLQKQNEKLMDEFGVRGFPTVFVLSPDGAVIEQTGYQAGGPEAYVAHIQKIIDGAK